MKRIIAILLVLAMLLALAGCNIKKKLSEKLAEEILEGNSDADVDIDGDSMTIEGEDGSTTTIGGTEWPTSDFAKNIPEFKDGTVSYLVEGDGYLYILLDGVKEKDAQNYIEELKKDYTENKYESTYEGGASYSATNADGLTVSATISEGSLMITLSKAN